MSRFLHLRPQRWAVLLAIVMLLLSSWACSSGASLIVINNTGSDLCAVYVVESTEAGLPAEWGENRLAAPPLASGQQYEIDLGTAGTYDLHAETCDGSFAERADQELDGAIEWTLTPE